MDRATLRLPSWMIFILSVLVCIVGLHFLADNSQHAGMAWGAELPTSQSTNESLDEHRLETSFIIPDDDGISSPLALAISISPDGTFARLLFAIPLLNPPRA